MQNLPRGRNNIRQSARRPLQMHRQRQVRPRPLLQKMDLKALLKQRQERKKLNAHKRNRMLDMQRKNIHPIQRKKSLRHVLKIQRKSQPKPISFLPLPDHPHFQFGLHQLSYQIYDFRPKLISTISYFTFPNHRLLFPSHSHLYCHPYLFHLRLFYGFSRYHRVLQSADNTKINNHQPQQSAPNVNVS